MKNTLLNMYRKDAVQKVLASLLSIVIGLVVGAVVVAIVGVTKKNIGLSGTWDGVRLIFFGIFAKGRDTAGQLAWGFNPRAWGDMLFRATPVIMTGLSVAIAFKTGLFNIGAPGQYLMGTLVTLVIALGIPSSAVPASAGVSVVVPAAGASVAGSVPPPQDTSAEEQRTAQRMRATSFFMFAIPFVNVWME